MKITNLLFRYFRLWPSLLLLPFTFASGQTTDLDVQILSPAEGDRVGIGEAFAVRAQIFHVDANSSDVVGEDITATVELVDPFGIVIASHAQSWDSFPNQIVTLDNDSTPAEQVILQMPWTEASKFHIGLNQTPYDDDDNKWTISVRVSSPSLESNIANNEEHIEIFLEVPDLEVANNISVQARNPVTGQFGNDIYPNSQLRVTGSINNIGAVMTQPGAHFPVEARLFEGQITSTTTLSKALSVDYERVILPASDGSSPTSVLSGSSVDYVISNLTLPPNAQGTYTIQVVADVASQENVYPPPGQVIEEIEEFDNNHLIVYINVDNGSPDLKVVEDSYFGDTGTFRGLDPVRIGFTIRNFGDLAVQGDRSIICKVALSEDDDFLDIDDYILREFDLSASALGEGLKPNETINFDWVQQMPTNLEGDFYLTVTILDIDVPIVRQFLVVENDQDSNYTEVEYQTNRQTFPLDNTPSITLTTEAQSSTRQLVSDENASELLNQVHDLEMTIDKLQRAIVEDPSLVGLLNSEISTLRTQIVDLKSQFALSLNSTPSERPHANLDGSKVVYEMDLNGIRQIYYVDLLSVDGPELVTRNFDFSENPSHGNGHSLRPRISSDGSTVVFHSRASNLVTGDFNDQEDVFLYRTDSKLLMRAHNLYGSNEPNKGSYYPDVNGDGTKVVFESEATNMQTNGVVTSGMQIFLWDLSYGGRGNLRALTQGNARSESASIDDFGNGVVFSSYATDLIANDQNEVSDIFYIGLASGSDTNDSGPYLVNLPNANVDPTGVSQAQGGNSEQPEISGDGSTVVYRSKAINLVNLKGISVVEVVSGGAGYFGNPTVLVTDSGSTGTGAVLSVENAFDVYGQLAQEGVSILNHGQNYSDPTVTLIPDPTQPSPTQDANLKAHLTHPDGELYTIKLDDVTGTNLSPEYSIRITETDGVGANRTTMNPSISYDGKTIVYSTKSSNLLDKQVTRADGQAYFNTPVKQAQARAILVGGIGEIEVVQPGSGYQNGFLKIEDHSGSGSGAIASYEVDSFGRISSITMISQGTDYLLESTVVEVDNPRGGSGFMAGALRFPESWGIGQARVGGGKIHKIEMLEHGAGYSEESLSSIDSGSFFSIEGDGIDINADGFADAKLNPSRVKYDSSDGGIYLEQKFNLEIISKTNLPTTVLTIEDANKSISVNFANQASQPFTIGILGNDLTEIRDDLIEIIQTQWSKPTHLSAGPQIDNNASGGIGFTFSALSGKLITSNPSSVRIQSQTNLLFSGAGFTRATPIVSPQPVIHGFSELLSGTTITSNPNGRNSYAANQDLSTDDIYLFDSDKNTNERVSRSHYGFPVNYLSSDLSTMPSNRFPSISGDARHVFFSSDASGKAGLAFKISNQVSVDVNVVRDIYHYDRKLNVVPSQSKITPTIVFPHKSSAYIIAETNASDPDQGLSGFQVIYGGDSYRYPPTLEFEGGGGEGATAVAVLKDGVIRKIDVSKPGYGYDPSKIRIKVLDDGLEHNGSTGFGLAVFQPIFNQSNGIESIQVLDGGSGYFPSSSTLTVLVDYNGSSTGYGFEAGPIYTSDGVVDSVMLLNKGNGYVSAPTVKVSGGGHDYVEGTPVHLRMIASEYAGIRDIRLIANGVTLLNRPTGVGNSPGGGGFVDIVMNEPYFDLFWIPDRNPASGVGAVDGLGLWELEIEVEDTAGNLSRTQAMEIRVVNSQPPVAKILNPEQNAAFILDPLTPITLVAEAYDLDGVITEVQFLINNANTGFDGNESFVVSTPPYKYDWRPTTVGEYEIKVIAIDNGFVSTISDSIKITVGEPVGEKPIADWFYPNTFTRGRTFDFYYFYYGLSTENTYINNDYAIGSTIPLNISAADDGTIVSVEFFVNNESVGFATKRYQEIYSMMWKSNVTEQALIYAKVKDNDGNIVRTSIRELNFGSNLGSTPSVELNYVRKAANGNYEARVLLKDVPIPQDPDFPPTNTNADPELNGDFALNLHVNGARVAGVGTDQLISGVGTLFIRAGGRNDYFFDFTNIEIDGNGFFDFQVSMRSRQNRRNFGQVLVSNTYQLYVQEVEEGTQLENIAPIGGVISPGASEFARILTVLDEYSPITGYSEVGVSKLKLTHFGSSYKTPPSIIISGGGGDGATAKSSIIDGAITNLTFDDSAYSQGGDSTSILSQGYDYKDGDMIFAKSLPIQFDYSKASDYSNGTLVQYPFQYDASMDYADGERVISNSKIWKKVGDQNGSSFGNLNPHSTPDKTNLTEWLEEASFPLYWKKVGDQKANEYSAPGTAMGEDQWEMAFYGEITVSNGVLDANQSFANGAIESKGSGYTISSEVNVIDISTGNGARGIVSKLDANGGVEEILIYRGGRNYNPLTTYFEILDSYGTGFRSSTPTYDEEANIVGGLQIIDGVITSYEILNPGENYSATLANPIVLLSSSLNGTGFGATATDLDITAGAMYSYLTNKGRGYTTPPIVTIQGGSFSANIEGRKKPMQVTAESPLYLFADATDLDGQVGTVRFYGNGDDLGIQLERRLTGIALLSAGSGYTQPPNVIISGGGGTGATAIANLVNPSPTVNNVTGQQTPGDPNEPRALASFILTSAGSGYSTTPDVQITGDGSGATARAVIEDVEIVSESIEHVAGTGRWMLRWVPRKPGTYLVDLEIIDYDGLASYYTTQNQIIVLPTQVSRKPEITMNNEHQGKAYTTSSTLRFTARARDLDGALEGVQFYVNGDLLGAEILADYAENQLQQPYSVEFAPPEPGVYTVFAIARDNSGNHIMSEPVTFTCTTGSGKPPIVRLTRPTMAAEGEAVVVDGKIEKVNLTLGGSGYVEAPLVKFYGKGEEANYISTVDSNSSSRNYSEVVSVVRGDGDESYGYNYIQESTTVEFEGGFAKLNASGKVATAEFSENPQIRTTVVTQNGNSISNTEYIYSIQIVDGGAGYVSAPRVTFVGAPQGMEGIAQIDEASGVVTGIAITNQGQNSVLFPSPQVFLTGGLSYSEILLEAFAEDQDEGGYVTEVSFYVNGDLLPDPDRFAGGGFDGNPDTRAPYQMLWSPEGPGIYEIFATAEDSDGNLITSPIIRREAVLSKPPVLEFNPRDRAYGYLDPELLDENGSIIPNNQSGIITNSLVSNGNGYHSTPTVEFISYDNEGNRIAIAENAQAIASTQNGSVSAIRLLKGDDSEFINGKGYQKYRKLTGQVDISSGSDLMVGIDTDFLNEVLIGQPLLLLEQGRSMDDQEYDIFYPLTFQSENELILDRAIDLNQSIDSATFDLYTYGTQVVLSGGMDTSSTPINLRQGTELALGVRVEDPEGKSIRTDNFTAFVNGVPDPTVIIQGTGPFYRVLYNPPDLGSYSIRVQVGDVDGARGISQPLDVRVAAGIEPTIRMISPINEAKSTENQLDEFTFGTTVSFTYEAKDFDGIIDVVDFYANSRPIGSWPQNRSLVPLDDNSTSTRREGSTNRYTVSWRALNPGYYTISASARDNSGLMAYAPAKTINIKATYKDGSLPPEATIVFPIEDREENEVDPPDYPLFKTPSYTSASQIPLIARGLDLDGSFETLSFYVNGEVLDAFSSTIQFLEKPNRGDTITISDGMTYNNQFVSKTFEFLDINEESNSSHVEIEISPIFQDLEILENHLNADKLEIPDGLLSEESLVELLSKYGVGGTLVNSRSGLENLIVGLREDAFDDQRMRTIDSIKKVMTTTTSSPNDLSIDISAIGFNGIMLKHTNPKLIEDENKALVSATNSNRSIVTKGFVKGLLRFPSRDSDNYHFTQLFTPPTSGVYTIVAIGKDSSGNQMMSSPISLTSTYGEEPPTVVMQSPLSGTQRSVSMVGEHAVGTAFHDWQRNYIGPPPPGAVLSVNLSYRGTGYRSPPRVVFKGAGFGARATAFIVEDPADPDFGQIERIEINDGGQGYFGNTVVEFRGGLGNETVFLNADADDKDGEIDGVDFIINGTVVSQDRTVPYARQEPLSAGYYEIIALAEDDAGNTVSSKPVQLNISMIRGASPSGFIIHPLPPRARELYGEQSQAYFWGFVEEYNELIVQQTQDLGNLPISFTLSSNSYIHLTSRATDSDGYIKDVEFYLNNKFLGTAERQNQSHHFTLPVDLSEFGEQPAYRIDTLIKDNANNVVIPNNPIYLEVLPATGSQPKIDIILPDPDATTPPKFSVNGQVALVVDVMPEEGTLDSVGLYANGRFIGDASLQNLTEGGEIVYGKQRYALNWTPENPGKYNLTAHVRDNMGTVIFTQKASVVDIVEDDYEVFATIEILPSQIENTDNQVARGSSLLANAEFLDANGSPMAMRQVDFFLNGLLQSTQDAPPYSLLFKPPSLQDRFVGTPFSWEVKVTGLDINDRNGTAIKYGTVLGITELPQITLSPIRGSETLPEGYLYDGMIQSVSVVAEGSEQALTGLLGNGITDPTSGLITFPNASDMVLYGNGIEIATAEPIPIISVEGNILSINYEFEWITDYNLVAKKTDGSVKVVAIIELLGDPTNEGSMPVVASNPQNVSLLFQGSTSIANMYTELTGQSVDSLNLDKAISDANASGTYDPQKDFPLVLLNLLNNADEFGQRVDIISAHHIATGEWHDSFTEFQDHIDLAQANQPAINALWLKDYIDYILSSPNEAYLRKFGTVPFLVGDESRKGSYKFSDIRMDFIQQCLENKYSEKPTFQQVFQGSNRIVNFWSEFEPNYWEIRGATGNPNPDSPPRRDTVAPNFYQAGECAVDVVFNLASEIDYQGGLPYILYTEDRRSFYRIAAFYYLFFEKNLGELREENIDEIKHFFSLGESNALSKMLIDYRWTSRFNKIWEFSTILFENWKNESWFGSFMDERFPWIFHSSLGWLYIEGGNRAAFWFYSSSQESWYWTGAKFFPHAYSSNKNSWVYFDTNTKMLYDFNEAKWDSY